MDKRQLITIAITAVISVLARELVTWAFSLVKHPLVRHTVRDRAKRTFTKNVRSILGWAFWFLWSVGWTVYYARKPGPPTRLDVVMMDIFISFASIDVIILAITVGFIRAARKAPTSSDDGQQENTA
jgi:hypothetical protein